MERNADDIYGATGDRGSTTGSTSSMGSGSAAPGALGYSIMDGLQMDQLIGKTGFRKRR